MSTRLTAYDHHGLKWTPDHTVRVTPRYETPSMLPDRRNKAAGYEVHDMLNLNEVGVATWVPHMRQAQLTANYILAARPQLGWEDWQRPTGRPSLRRGGAANTCAADSPAGRVEVQVWLQEDREHPGMWCMSFSVGGLDFGWLSDIRYVRHRMANVRAVAEYRAFRLAKPPMLEKGE